MPSFAIVLSHVFGWISTIAWSISFYPQLILNFRRRSVSGLSLDFITLNPFGFLSYFIYNLSLFTSKTVRRQYRQRHEVQDANPSVRLNDVVFSAHALIISSITLLQYLFYRHTSNQTLSTYNRFFLSVSLLAIVLSLIVASTSDLLQWLDVIYFLSYIKLYISTAKYIPQAYLNYKKQSTVGWSIENILLDFLGGSLSLAQLILDAWISNDWQSITGNPGKLGLGFLSIFFDLLFITQHYILYRNESAGGMAKLSIFSDPSSHREQPVGEEEPGRENGERTRLLV